MEHDTITAFQATQAVCIKLIKSGFDYAEAGVGNKTCAWEKVLNSANDMLQIAISDTFISASGPAPECPITFTVCIHIAGVMKIEVISHNLKLDSFETDLARLESMAQNMIEQLRSGEGSDEYRMAS